MQGTPLPAMAVLLGEFGSKDYGDNGDTNSDTTVYSDVDKQWLRDTAAYARRLSESTHSPVSWFFWAWNANSGKAQPLLARRCCCDMPAGISAVGAPLLENCQLVQSQALRTALGLAGASQLTTVTVL